MKKYVIIPGYVTSKSDGQKHFISSTQLLMLYGVSPNECVFYDRRMRGSYDHLIALTPRHNGDYTIPKN